MANYDENLWQKRYALSTHLTSISTSIINYQPHSTHQQQYICNRIEYDLVRFGHNRLFSQLFVSCSTKLCKYVSGIVGCSDQTSFTTFGSLVYELDLSLPQVENSSKSFLPSQHVNFSRFRREFYDGLHSK